MAEKVRLCGPGRAHKFPSGVLMINSKILQIATPIFRYFGTEVWRELYPGAFGFESFVSGSLSSGQYFFKTADGVFASPNGFFSCTVSWSAKLLAGSTTPPSPAVTGCTSIIPSWYETQLRTQ